MKTDEIFEKLKEMLSERFGVDASTLTGTTRQKDIGIDSILMVDLMLDIESELGFSFESLDLPPNPSLDQLCDMIKRNMPSAD